MLNFSKRIIVGLHLKSGTVYKLPEAQILPINNDKDKNKASVKFSFQVTAGSVTVSDHQNKPLPGFTLYTADRKHYGADKSWLVIDPRGFLVRISTENVADILACTGITEGLIQDRCVWARENSKSRMILVPESSPIYEKVCDNTEMLDTKVSMRDVNIGDTVLLQCGNTGIYRGTYSLYGGTVQEYGSFIPVTRLKRQVVELDPGFMYYASNAKILKVLNKTVTPITKDEGLEFLKSALSSGVFFSMDSNVKTSSRKHYGPYSTITHISSIHEKPVLHLEEISQNDAIDIQKLTSPDEVNLVVMDKSGAMFACPGNRSFYNGSGNAYVFPERVTISANSLEKNDKEAVSWFRSTKQPMELGTYEKFFAVRKKIKTEFYS